MKLVLVVLTFALGVVGIEATLAGATNWITWLALALAIGGSVGAAVIDRVRDAATPFATTLGIGCALIGLIGLVSRSTAWVSVSCLVFGAMFGLVAFFARMPVATAPMDHALA